MKRLLLIFALVSLTANAEGDLARETIDWINNFLVTGTTITFMGHTEGGQPCEFVLTNQGSGSFLAKVGIIGDEDPDFRISTTEFGVDKGYPTWAAFYGDKTIIGVEFWGPNKPVSATAESGRKSIACDKYR